MELLTREIAEHYSDYNFAKIVASKLGKNEAALYFSTEESDTLVKYNGVLSPFIPHIDEVQLAMIFGYDKYFNGGTVEINHTGNFIIEFKKEN